MKGLKSIDPWEGQHSYIFPDNVDICDTAKHRVDQEAFTEGKAQYH